MPVHQKNKAQPSHGVSRWHCLPSKRGKHLGINISPSSHVSLISAFFTLLAPLFFFFCLLGAPSEFFYRGTNCGPWSIVKGLILSKLRSFINRRQHRDRAGPFAEQHRGKQRFGQFGQPLSSCGDFPL